VPCRATVAGLAVVVAASACSSARRAGPGGDDGGPPSPVDAGTAPDARAEDAGGAPADGPRSFDVVAQLRYPPGTVPPEGVLTPLGFLITLAIIDDGAGPRVVLSGPGQVFSAALTSPARRRYELAPGDALSLPIPEESSGCSRAFPPNLAALSLELVDGDGDGAMDTVEGEAAGSVSFLLGDVIFPLDVEVTLEGELDRTAPVAAVQGVTEERHPMDLVWVQASEALTPEAGISLRPAAGGPPVSPVMLVPRAGRSIPEVTDGIGRFDAPVGTVLAFGAAYELAAGPPLDDLGGLRGAITPGRLTTIADPGRATGTVGFEGPLAPPMSGVLILSGADWSTAAGPFTPPSGNTALLLHPGGRATIVLRAEEPAERIRFAYRLLGKGPSGFLSTSVRVAVAERRDPLRTDLDAASPTRFTETGDRDWGWESDVAIATVAIDEGVAAGETVLVDFQGYGPVVCGFGPPAAPVLIDDVRLE